MAGKSGQSHTSNRLPVLLITPLQVLLTFILVFPFGLAIYLSFTTWSPLQGIPWWKANLAGVTNFVDMFGDARLWNAVMRTLLIVGVSVSVELGIGFGLALLFFNWQFPMKKVLISMFLIPMMILPIVAGYNFYVLFFEDGPANQFLSFLTGTTQKIPWLSDSRLVLFPIMLADIWQWTPFMFLVFYSALHALPAEPFKAARVLGAKSLQIARHLTIPMLKPIMTIAILIRSLEAFKIFDVPFIMTGGGPGFASETFSIYMMKQGLQFWKISYVSAIALVILTIISVVTWYSAQPLLRGVQKAQPS